MDTCVLRHFEKPLCKVLLCVSVIPVAILKSRCAVSSVFMELQEYWDHLTGCMYIGKIVLLLFRDHIWERKFATIVLEAVAEKNLWFWHAAFGFVGGYNDINILDVSPCTLTFLDGSHAKIDFDYSLGDFIFKKLFYFIGGIYPQLTQFAKTILMMLTKKEKKFAGWQEATRKDVERVLQSKWHLLASPINMLLQQNSEQMGNNLAEQQVNNNNKAKQNNKHKNNSLHHYPKL